MQTPPPTSTSALRRKAQQAQVAKLVQESAAAGRRISAPLFPQVGNVESSLIRKEASPQRFPALDFSPDIFDFSTSGPITTAPNFPQNRLFWEPKDDDDMNIDFSADIANPFDTPRQPPLDPFISVHSHASASGPQTSMSLSNFDDVGSKAGLNDTASSCFTQAGFVSTAGLIGDRHMHQATSVDGVDPSLLFSSPSKSLRPLNTSMAFIRVVDADSLQPYAYQIQEAKRDKAFGGILKAKKKRKPDCDSPAVTAALETLRGDGPERPKLYRSATDSVTIRTNSDTRKFSEQSSSNRVDNTLGQRRTSPIRLIRSSRFHGNALYPRRRTALALTIDSTGRARTEARPFLDGTDTTNVRMELTELGMESDDTDSDTSSNQSTIGMITSQTTSFDISSWKPRSAKAGRSAQDSVSHSSKSSYTSSYISSSNAENWQTTNNANSSLYSASTGEKRHGTKFVQNQLALRTDFEYVNDTRVEEEVSEAETVLESDEGNGSAQHELRKVLKDRQAAKKSMSEEEGRSKHSPINHSTACLIQRHHNTHEKGTAGNLSGLSPSTMSDPDLPSPRSQSNISNNIRCICHDTLNDGEMVSWYVSKIIRVLDEAESEQRILQKIIARQMCSS
ncbi:hypothetical protein MMC26_004144 [Xylographa opegraphella]|nr:hypothetical protein [Xylographa opegraphella]